MKKSVVVPLTLFCFTASLFAQQNKTVLAESEIVMSEAQISSLAKTLIKYKNRSFLKMEEVNNSDYLSLNNSKEDLETEYLKQQIHNLEMQLQNRISTPTTITPNFTPNYNNNRDIKALEYEIQRLQFKLDTNKGKAQNAPNVINLMEKRPPSNLPLKGQDLNINEREFAFLQERMDSIQSLIKNTKTPVDINYKDDFDALQQKMNDLKNNMEVRNKQPDGSELLKSKYGKFKKEVFFTNNSIALNEEGIAIVDEFYSIMEANVLLDIVVHGFASTKGSIKRNEEISMQRTESVKKALMLRGIHPNRILTQYHGIDYTAATEADARRVEISFLIVK